MIRGTNRRPRQMFDLEEVFEKRSTQKVTCIGELLLNRFACGETSRTSPESVKQFVTRGCSTSDSFGFWLRCAIGYRGRVGEILSVRALITKRRLLARRRGPSRFERGGRWRHSPHRFHTGHPMRKSCADHCSRVATTQHQSVRPINSGHSAVIARGSK